MYKIIKEGATLGMTEAPTFIKRQDGCFVLCPENEAQGVVHNGTPYHLAGRESMDGAETVAMEETDAGAYIMDMQGAIDDLVIASLEGGITNV